MTQVNSAGRRTVHREKARSLPVPAPNLGDPLHPMELDTVHWSSDPLATVANPYPKDPLFSSFLSVFAPPEPTLVQHAQRFVDEGHDDVAAYAQLKNLKEKSFARAIRNNPRAKAHLARKRLESPPPPRPILYTPMQRHIDKFIAGGYTNIQQYAKANNLSVPSFRLALHKSQRGKIYVEKLKAEGRFHIRKQSDPARMARMLPHVQNLIASEKLNFSAYAKAHSLSPYTLRDCFYASEEGKQYVQSMKESEVQVKRFPMDRKKASKIQAALLEIEKNPENGIASVARKRKIPPSTLAYRIRRAKAAEEQTPPGSIAKRPALLIGGDEFQAPNIEKAEPSRTSSRLRVVRARARNPNAVLS